MAHLCHSLRSVFQQHGHRVATICDERQASGQQLHDRVASLSAAMVCALGVRPGDRVAIAARNTDWLLEMLLATWDCGCIAALINWRWSADEAGAAMALCTPSILVTDDQCWELMQQALQRTSQYTSVRALIALGSFGHNQPDPALKGSRAMCYVSEQLILEHSSCVELQTLQPPDGTAVICFTSGTTGRSKGVKLSHAALTFQSMAKLAVVGYNCHDVYLHTAPLVHVGGLSSALATLMSGGVHVFVPSYSPQSALQLLRRHRCTSMIAVPAMLEDLRQAVAAAAAAERGCSTSAAHLPLRRLLVGAGGMSEQQQEAVQEMFPRAAILTAYGMTEACSSITFNTLRKAPAVAREEQPAVAHKELPGHAHATAGNVASDSAAAVADGARFDQGTCVGYPAPGIEVRIEGCEGRGGSAVRCVGQVLTRGPHVMMGYWDAPEQTAQALSTDGWLRTGDIGYMDGAGRLWLLGRSKDMIKSAGENVYASEVEAVLLRHPAVRAAAVVGLPHPRLGEQVAGLLVLEPGWTWRVDGPSSSQGTQQGADSENTSAAAHSEMGAAPRIDDDSTGSTTSLSAGAVQQYCRRHGLSSYKVPRFIVAQQDGLPLNSTGKVLKHIVRNVLMTTASRTSQKHSKL